MKNALRVFLTFLVFTTLHTSYSITFFENFTWWWDNTEEEVTAHEQTLTPGCHISVANKKGNITIKTWNKNKLLIEITKRGSKEELILTKIETLYTKDGASIKTVPLKTDRQCTVDYALVIPNSAILSMVQTEKGSINIKNVSTPGTRAHAEYGSVTLDAVTNSVQASTKRGGISIHAKELKSTDKIIALAERGSIQLEVPATINATLYARTEKGSVMSEHPITMEPRTIKISQTALAELKRDVRGTLGHGGAVIKLQTSRGNVRVLEAA